MEKCQPVQSAQSQLEAATEDPALEATEMNPKSISRLWNRIELV